MNKIVTTFCVSLGIVGLSISAAPAADSLPSSKTTAAVGYMSIVKGSVAASALEESAWQTIMSSQLKTANQADLFVDVSLQSAVYTQTLVKSKGGTTDTASAYAGVRVRVLVDGVPSMPGADGVIFNDRYQQLSATLQGQLEWADRDGDGQIDEIAIADYESIDLVLRTTSANAFNFLSPNVSSGVHTIEVQALVASSDIAGNGTASATAVIGAGAVRVDEVRMATGDTGSGL